MSANSSRIGLKLFVVLVVLAGAGAAVWYSFRLVAKVAIVRPGKASDIRPGTVVVAPEKVVEITSEVDGRLIENDMAPGKIVKQGDKLAQIDATDIEIDIKHNESELSALKETIRLNGEKADLAWKTTEEEFKENERLHKIQSLADVPFTRMQRAFDGQKQDRELAKVADGRSVENLEHTIEVLKRQRDKATLTAPFDGVISQVLVHPGAQIDKRQSLGTLITTTRTVTGKISEENFAKIQLGQKATVKFLGYGDETFDAKVSKKLPTAEEATQRYLIYLDVAIAPERLLPNLTGDVAVVVDQREAQALVPPRAIIDGQFVYVVDHGRVTKRKIALGFTSFTAAEVTEGLKAGEQVITDELDKFSEGDRVRTETMKW